MPNSKRETTNLFSPPTGPFIFQPASTCSLHTDNRTRQRPRASLNPQSTRQPTSRLARSETISKVSSTFASPVLPAVTRSPQLSSAGPPPPNHRRHPPSPSPSSTTSIRRPGINQTTKPCARLLTHHPDPNSHPALPSPSRDPRSGIYSRRLPLALSTSRLAKRVPSVRSALAVIFGASNINLASPSCPLCTAHLQPSIATTQATLVPNQYHASQHARQPPSASYSLLIPKSCPGHASSAANSS